MVRAYHLYVALQLHDTPVVGDGRFIRADAVTRFVIGLSYQKAGLLQDNVPVIEDMSYRPVHLPDKFAILVVRQTEVFHPLRYAALFVGCVSSGPHESYYQHYQ